MLRLTVMSLASAPFTWRGVDPAVLRQWPTSYEGLTLEGHRYPDGAAAAPLRLPDDIVPAAGAGSGRRQEMVLLVGFPGCGKSTFCRRFFEPHGYIRINQDELKTKEKCIRAAAAAWAAGKSVVVDNTNPASATRRAFIDILSQHAAQGRTSSSSGSSSSSSRSHNTSNSNKRGANTKRDMDTLPWPVRVFVFEHSMDEAMHLNEVRRAAGVSASKVPTIAYHTFKKQFEGYDPALIRSEGVEVVYSVPPVVCFDGLSEEVERHFFQLQKRKK